MRKIVVIISVFISTLSFSQGMFDSLENLDDVSTVVVTKDMFELLKKFPDAQSDDMEAFNAMKGLTELKVFSTDKPGVGAKMNGMFAKAVASQNLTQLMRIKDKGARVKIYVESTKQKDVVSKVLMYVDSKDDNDSDSTISILSLTGEIDVNKLAKLANTYEKK